MLLARVVLLLVVSYDERCRVRCVCTIHTHADVHGVRGGWARDAGEETDDDDETLGICCPPIAWTWSDERADTTRARTLLAGARAGAAYGGSSIVDRDVACAQHGSGCCGPGITNLASPAACPVAGEPPAQQHPSRVHVRSPLSISISAAATTTVDSARLQPHLLAS